MVVLAYSGHPVSDVPAMCGEYIPSHKHTQRQHVELNIRHLSKQAISG